MLQGHFLLCEMIVRQEMEKVLVSEYTVVCDIGGLHVCSFLWGLVFCEILQGCATSECYREGPAGCVWSGHVLDVCAGVYERPVSAPVTFAWLLLVFTRWNH